MTALDEHEVSGTGQKDEDSTGCLVIAGLSGGSGKSVASVALTAALQRRGYAVVPFKGDKIISMQAGWYCCRTSLL